VQLYYYQKSNKNYQFLHDFEEAEETTLIPAVVVQRSRNLVNCVLVRCAPSRTEVENFLQPKPSKRSPVNGSSR
jgi:hypothetical protein